MNGNSSSTDEVPALPESTKATDGSGMDNSPGSTEFEKDDDIETFSDALEEVSDVVVKPIETEQEEPDLAILYDSELSEEIDSDDEEASREAEEDLILAAHSAAVAAAAASAFAKSPSEAANAARAHAPREQTGRKKGRAHRGDAPKSVKLQSVRYYLMKIIQDREQLAVEREAAGAVPVAQDAPVVAQTEIISSPLTEKGDDVDNDQDVEEGDREDETPLTKSAESKVGSVTRRQVFMKKLASGENESFLRNLLMLSSVRIAADDNKSVTVTGTSPVKNSAPIDSAEATPEEDKVAAAFAVAAARKVYKLLLKTDGSYDFMLKMLPPVEDGVNSNGNKSVPDLLPPASASPGDATSDFFRACAPVEKQKSLQNNSPELSPLADLSTESIIDESSNSKLRSPSRGSPSRGRGANGRASEPAATSVFSSVFSSMGRNGGGKNPSSPPAKERASLSSVFSKRRPGARDKSAASVATASTSQETSSVILSDSDDDDDFNIHQAEYCVNIDREMLGLTVENVLERTVVRTVLPGGAAKHAGARVGSLIVKVGSVETTNLTHFETIDELRQSQRPLKLVLRRISKDALRGAREEMGRLIRGGGFGVSAGVGLGGEDGDNTIGSNSDNGKGQYLPSVDEFADLLRQRWSPEQAAFRNPKEEALSRVGEKLVWILTLLVVGLEREAAQSDDHHTAKEYADASKSVSKIVADFVKVQLKVDPPPPQNRHTQVGKNNTQGPFMGNPNLHKRGRKYNAPPLTPLLGKHAAKNMAKRQQHQEMLALHGGPPGSGTQTAYSESPLLQIGDVLHRTIHFLADPLSPPAALLRGELIALLCDILDIDTDMELSEDETASASVGQNSRGSISDLGSAGSLLKLIVLNCSQPSQARMESSSDRKQSSKGSREANMYAGNRFLAVVHRLAASRSTSARVIACSLGPVLWGHLDFPHQLQLRGVITRALHDAEVIVRKSTATVLHEIAELVFDSRSVPWLVLMCERAMTDPEPQLRAAAMTLTWHLAEHLPNAFLGDASKGSLSLQRLPPRSDPVFADVYLLQCKLLPVATRLAEDRAPLVRLAVAAQCDRLSNALGHHWSSVIIDLLQALLRDTDDRVRGEAVLCVPRLVESVIMGSMMGSESTGINVLDALLPVSMKLLKDPSVTVRVSLATASGELLTFLVGIDRLEEISPPTSSPDASSTVSGVKHHKRHIDDTLIPLVQKLLHDTDPEVTSASLRAVTNASRGNVREISSRRMPGRHRSDTVEDDNMSVTSFQSHASVEKKEPVFIPVLSEDQVLRLLPTLSDLATSGQWRVRQSAVEIVPALLGCTHRLETRSEIAQLCVQLMGDTVDAVRLRAAECLCLGGGSLGGHGEDSKGEWINAIVIPHLKTCSKSPNSKQRLLSLKMVEAILINEVCSASGKTSSASEEEAVSPLQTLIELAGSLKSDRVANVRLNVGRIFGSIVNMLEEDNLKYVIATLNQQMEEERAKEGGGDRDVLYFANRAIGWAQIQLEDVSEVSSQAESMASLSITKI
eukprot:CAMPEP_0198283356 /NCGR_PEP_ID=MMETSP1449-20131203/2975_1 /TAXON_ID=420275 /ORGANISM="Attheya septentrionalis, Strain CCMP2084" /LENGTH=1517 /DNA_ID=CAMNT_0043979941 /DNA_START=397 /DNA_END=4950 /DNA_ORIENTATION=-